MNSRPFNCVVLATKSRLVGNEFRIMPDTAVYFCLATNEAEAEKLVLDRYKSYPDKLAYTQISVYVVDLRPQRLIELLEGEVLELGLKKLEAVDELDAEIIC